MTTAQRWQLASLTIGNFKSIRHPHLAIRPVTLLMGPNNSGKSCAIAVSETMKPARPR